jgi:hypothetical protein
VPTADYGCLVAAAGSSAYSFDPALCPQCFETSHTEKVPTLSPPLAAALPPPGLPTKQGTLTCGPLFLLGVSIVWLALTLPHSLFFAFLTSDTGAGLSASTALNVTLAASAPPLLTLLILALTLPRAARRHRSRYQEAVRVHVAATTLREQLYYCTRCDGVYWPGLLTTFRPKDPRHSTDRRFGRRLIPRASYWPTLYAAAASLVAMTDSAVWAR